MWKAKPGPVFAISHFFVAALSFINQHAARLSIYASAMANRMVLDEFASRAIQIAILNAFGIIFARLFV